MIIESIHIKSFGKLRDFDLELDRQMHIFAGPNESGKTTLSAFIRYMLYGFSGRGGEGSLSERRRRISWEGGRADGSMVICTKEGRFRIERQTEEVEGGRFRESSAIIDLQTGAPCHGRSAAGEVFLGVPEEVFLESAYFGQMADAAVNGGKMREAVENILFSGDERINTQKAITRLDEARRSLLHKSEKGGIIVELRKEREELQARLVEVDRLKDGLLEKEAMLKDTVVRKEEAAREGAKFTKLEADLRNALLIRDYDYLHGLEEEHHQLSETLENFEKETGHGGFFPSHEYLTEIAVARQGNKDAYRTFAASTAVLERIRTDKVSEACAEWIPEVDAAGGEECILATYKELRRGGVGRFVGSMLAFAGGLGFLIFAFAFLLPHGWFIPMALAIGGMIATAVAGVVLLLSSRRILKEAASITEKFQVSGAEGLAQILERIREARRRMADRQEKRDQAEETHTENDQRYRMACCALENLAARWGRELPPVGAQRDAALDALVADASHAIEERSRMRSQLASMAASIREMRRQLGDRNEVIVRGSVAPADREMLINLNHKDLLEGIKRCQLQVQFYSGKEREIEKQLIEFKAKVADPAAISEKIEALDRRIADLEAKHAAYALALESIKEAGASLRREISPRLAEYADGLLAEVTGGKYPALGVGDDFSVSVHDGEKTRSVEYLSAGTQDAAYLSLRMALVDLLYKEPPPLCFDETLGRQDDERAKGVLRIFRKLGEEGRQCLLFTCHKRDLDLAERTLPFRLTEMGGPLTEGAV